MGALRLRCLTSTHQNPCCGARGRVLHSVAPYLASASRVVCGKHRRRCLDTEAISPTAGLGGMDMPRVLTRCLVCSDGQGVFSGFVKSKPRSKAHRIGTVWTGQTRAHGLGRLNSPPSLLVPQNLTGCQVPEVQRGECFGTNRSQSSAPPSINNKRSKS